MTGLRCAGFLYLAVALLPAGSVRAHHSFATHYLMDRSVEITGVVTEASLRNPHSFFTLEVTTEDGTVEWEVEAHAIPLLRRIGSTPKPLNRATRLRLSDQHPEAPGV